MTPSKLWPAAWSASLLACASSGAFGGLSPDFPDNRVEDVRRALDGVRVHADARPCVVGATEGELFAYDLEQRELLWRTPSNLRGVPYAVGDYVASQERREDGESLVVLRRLDDGAEVFSVSDGELHLVGAGGEGDVVALSLSTGGGVGAESRLIVLRGASRSWEVTAPQPFGGPTVAGQRVFVPWSHQNLSIFDVGGNELARLRVDGVLGATRAHAGHVYVGQLAAYRVDESLSGGQEDQANAVRYDTSDLPGKPSFFGRSYDPPDPPTSATHRIRLEWSVEDDGSSVALDRGQVYSLFFRTVFAIDGGTDDVRWARTVEHDVVGAQALRTGLLIADASGELRLFRPDGGATTTLGRLGLEPLAVRFRAEGWSPADTTADASLTLGQQLYEVARDPDARLAPAQAFAVAALATRQDAEATGHLVALCDHREGPDQIRQAACEALGSRTVGPESVLTALERHGRFLEDTTPPPVGALAHAAGHLQEERAVPLLIEHLSDPATAASDLANVFKALGVLGDTDTANPIRKFIRLYHADVAEPPMDAGLRAAIEALVTLEGAQARDLLEDLLGDPLTDPRVRAHAVRAAGELDQAEREAQSDDEESADDEGSAEATESSSNERPDRMSSAVIEETLQPVAAQLRRCLGEVPGFPRTGRLVLVFDAQSQIETLSVLPQEATGCIAPLVRSQEFPRTHERQRQQVTYTFHR